MLLPHFVIILGDVVGGEGQPLVVIDTAAGKKELIVGFPDELDDKLFVQGGSLLVSHTALPSRPWLGALDAPS
jgi:hypothetical protein